MSLESDAGGERAAGEMMRIEPAKMNSVDPKSRPRSALGRIADQKRTRLDALPPWR